jgi:hypothetical protein
VKRFVYVPHNLHDGENPPQKALEMAMDSCLSIVLGSEDDGIHSDLITFAAMPEHRFLDAPEQARVGYVHMVDITDEFTVFCNDARMEYVLNDESFTLKPRLRETHKILFRPRFESVGTVRYSIINCGTEYLTGEIYVQ